MVAELEPKDVVKGSELVMHGPIGIAFDSSEELSDAFRVGEDVIVFLQPWSHRFRVTRGYVGKIEIEGEMAKTVKVAREPDHQPVAALMARLRRVPHKSS